MHRFLNSQFLPAVVLTPVGEVTVCVEPQAPFYKTDMASLTCTGDGVLWSTSGFGEGLYDQTHVPAVSLAHSSVRVTTTDTSILTNTSSITLSNFTYDDHGATITCEDHLQAGRQSVTISVGKFEIQSMVVGLGYYCQQE